MSDWPVLSVIVFTPWAGALLLAVWRRPDAAFARGTALVFSLSTLAIGLALLGLDLARPPVGAPAFSLVEQHAWIASLGVSYHLGLDGVSRLLVLLTGLVTPAALLASWRDQRQPQLFGALMLWLQGAALGVFLALDFFLWFVFWELSLVPVFFLIKLWGGPQRTRAAYQFVIYTLAGSAFMLLGFAAIVAATGTLDLLRLAQLASSGALSRQLGALAPAVFLGVFAGVAVKVPLFPFHTWLPSAYAEAPTGVSMFLTGVMSKMGVYGFFRILWPLFPEQLHAASGVLLWLALGGAVFGAFAAMAQTDLKRMVAYSSLNHLSYCLLAFFAVAGAGPAATATRAAVDAALSGAFLQVFNHGLSASALFFFVGALETRSGGRRGLGDFGGVRTHAPVFAGLCGIAMFSSLGLPGLNGFVGEFLVFRGVFALAPWAAAIGCIALLATALFLLTFYQRVFHGPMGAVAAGGFRDLSPLEIATVAPTIVLMFILGVAPQLALVAVDAPAVASRLLSP